MSEPEWYAAVVGENDVRVWPMSDGQPIGPAQTHTRAELEDLRGPIIAAGLDVPARDVPAKPDMSTTHVQGLHQVAAIAMLRQSNPPALTRGSEVAIQGYLSANPDFDGVLLVLAEESCWAHVSADEVVSFQTFLTAGIADALSASVPDLDAAFDAALEDTLSRPDRLAQHLASAKAAGTGQIMAHLIGAEIAASKPYWLGQQVVILSDDPSSALYERALKHQGVPAHVNNLTDAYLRGFTAAWRLLTDQSS